MADNYTLNGVVLSGLVLEADLSPAGVRVETAQTLSGRTVIWEQASSGASYLNLVGGSDFGWMTRANLATLQGNASVAGATYTLVPPTGSNKTVRFRNEDAPAIEAAPLVARPNQASDDYYNNIKIKLMEV